MTRWTTLAFAAAVGVSYIIGYAGGQIAAERERMDRPDEDEWTSYYEGTRLRPLDVWPALRGRQRGEH